MEFKNSVREEHQLLQRGGRLAYTLTAMWVVWLASVALSAVYSVAYLPAPLAWLLALLYVIAAPVATLVLAILLLSTVVRLWRKGMNLRIGFFILTILISLGLLITYAAIWTGIANLQGI